MSSYGAVTTEVVESGEQGQLQEVPDISQKGSVFSVGLKAFALFLLFAGVSVMAVSVSRSFNEETSDASFDSTFTSRVTYSLLTDDQKSDLFSDFITTYSRAYAQEAEEYNKRLAVFKSNLDIADDRNAKEALVNGSAVHGVTKFSDLTSEEFLSTYVMQDNTARRRELRERVRKLLKSPSSPSAPQQASSTSKRSLSPRGSSGPNGISSDPTLIYVDWSDTLTTSVKNQGECASGWAFAATQQIESDAIAEGLITTQTPLSVQELLSCSGASDGCSYGSIEDAYTYAQKPGGMYYASDYAYTASFGTVDSCSNPGMNYAMTIGGTFSLNTDGQTYNAERMMLAHVTDTGPISVCFDATTWSTYVSGTITNCDGNTVNHCAQIVGVYYSSATDTGFYKVRNSWGSEWGLNGYASINYGADTCGIAYNPYYSDPVRSG